MAPQRVTGEADSGGSAGYSQLPAPTDPIRDSPRHQTAKHHPPSGWSGVFGGFWSGPRGLSQYSDSWWNLCRDGKVFLVDFGAVQDDYRQTLIRGGTFVSTLGYMPPEQFRGQVFFGSDLYALGATLLFLLTHRSPADLPHSTIYWER